MMTTIVNLSTGEERIYDLAPQQAVIAAVEKERGNSNTWTYKNSGVKTIIGQLSVAAGDWCTMINMERVK